MEIKTCEQYVLAELDRTTKRLAIIEKEKEEILSNLIETNKELLLLKEVLGRRLVLEDEYLRLDYISFKDYRGDDNQENIDYNILKNYYSNSTLNDL